MFDKTSLKKIIKSKIDENKDIITKAKSGATELVGSSGEIIKKGINYVSTEGIKAKDKVMGTLDVNNDGSVDIQDIITLGLKTPGVRVDREKFLRKELKMSFSPETIDMAIKTNPLNAGIEPEHIESIVDEVIKSERYCVSGLSTALGAPGGALMVATVPADIIQYYGYMLRTAQKLMYLYGFPEIVSEGEECNLNSSTMNTLIVSMGVMFGVANANNAMKAMAKALGNGVQKELMKKALTKGTIYPIVKNISKWFGVRMTKEVFTGFFKKALPVVGGLIGGGITYVSFKPCCDNLKNSLKSTKLSNSRYIEQKEVNIIYDQIITGNDSTGYDEDLANN